MEYDTFYNALIDARKERGCDKPCASSFGLCACEDAAHELMGARSDNERAEVKEKIRINKALEDRVDEIEKTTAGAGDYRLTKEQIFPLLDD